MIGFLLLQATLPLTLGAIGRQALPPSGCAVYLWTRSETPQLVGMAAAEPGVLRLQLDGRPLDLPRTEAQGATARGFAATSRYAAGEVSATLELVAVDRPDLSDGALVQEAMLTVAKTGQDATVTPLGGLIGCAPAASPSPPTQNGGRR